MKISQDCEGVSIAKIRPEVQALTPRPGAKREQPWIRIKKLPPVALVPDVPAALLAPLSRHPDGTGMRRPDVVAGNPDVMVAVPAIEASDPDPIEVSRWSRGHHHNRGRRWRPDPNDNLRL